MRYSCSCFFNSAFGLFCSHIMLIRQENDGTDYSLRDCIPRWRRDYTGPAIEFLESPLASVAAMAAHGDDEQMLLDVIRYDALPKEKRYTKALEALKPVASFVSEFGGQTFVSYLRVLEVLASAIQSNTPPVKLVTALETAAEGLTSSTVADLTTENSEDHVVVPSLVSPSRLHNTTTTSPARNSNLFNFKLPGFITRPPGRVKGTTPKISFSQTKPKKLGVKKSASKSTNALPKITEKYSTTPRQSDSSTPKHKLLGSPITDGSLRNRYMI